MLLRLDVISTLKSLKQHLGLETDVEAVLHLLAPYFLDQIIPEFELSPDFSNVRRYHPASIKESSPKSFFFVFKQHSMR